MNILIEKQSVPGHGDVKPTGMKHSSMTLWAGLHSENKEVASNLE